MLVKKCHLSNPVRVTFFFLDPGTIWDFAIYLFTHNRKSGLIHIKKAASWPKPEGIRLQTLGDQQEDFGLNSTYSTIHVMLQILFLASVRWLNNKDCRSLMQKQFKFYFMPEKTLILLSLATLTVCCYGERKKMVL